MKELVALVADKNTKATLEALLNRPEALAIPTIQYDVFVHPRRDPGVLNEAHDFLEPYASNYNYALVMFDHDGCGQEEKSVVELQTQIQNALDQKGWEGRSKIIVIEPELENWVWSDSPHVAKALGIDQVELANLLSKHIPQGSTKPSNPRELLEHILRQSRTPRSSSIYEQIARNVSVQRCTDQRFIELKQTLTTWFPRSSNS